MFRRINQILPPSGSDSEVTESDIDQDTVNYLSTDKQLSPEKLEIIEQKLQNFFQWEVVLKRLEEVKLVRGVGKIKRVSGLLVESIGRKFSRRNLYDYWKTSRGNTC